MVCVYYILTHNCSPFLLSQAIAACLATFMLDVVNTGSRTSVKPPSILEKVQSFTNQQKKTKNKRKVCLLSFSLSLSVCLSLSLTLSPSISSSLPFLFQFDYVVL